MGKVAGGDGQGLGSLRVSSGVLGLRFPKSQWVQIRATYIMLITFIESKGDRVEGV